MQAIEFEQEPDGRWLAEIPALPGVTVYGGSRTEARSKAVSLACRVIADRIEHGESIPAEVNPLFVPA